MRNNGDMYLYAMTNAGVGIALVGLACNMLARDPSWFAGYLSGGAGVCLLLAGWIIASSVHYRFYGRDRWWSSRRLFKLSKHELQHLRR
jgi:hypothetical protein